MTAITPDIELGLIAACLRTPSVPDRLLADGLRAEHFATIEAGQAFAAIAALRDRGATPDRQLLAADLARSGIKHPGAVLDQAVNSEPAVGAVIEHARRIRTAAKHRQREQAARKALTAAQAHDDEQWAAAMRLIETAAPGGGQEIYSPDRLAELLFAYLDKPEGTPEATPLPFHELTEAMDGGLRPGDLMVLAGWTNHGKSILADCIADDAADDGRRCHLYLTEMTAIERGLRLLARRSRIPMRHLKRRKLTPAQRQIAVNALTNLPYGFTIVSDWSIDDVCRDIRRARWDLAVVDLMHGFAYRDERDLDAISKSLMRTAKASTTEHNGTAIIAVAHLNDGMMRDTRSLKRPKPGMHALKGASSIKQDADMVCFVWQQDDDDGLPTGEGSIWLAKGRQTALAAVDVQLNPRTLRFERPGTKPVEGVAA